MNQTESLKVSMNGQTQRFKEQSIWGNDVSRCSAGDRGLTLAKHQAQQHAEMDSPDSNRLLSDQLFCLYFHIEKLAPCALESRIPSPASEIRAYRWYNIIVTTDLKIQLLFPFLKYSCVSMCVEVRVHVHSRGINLAFWDMVSHWPGPEASGSLPIPTWPVRGLEACATKPRCFSFPSWKLKSSSNA